MERSEYEMDLLYLADRHLAPNYAPLPVIFEKAKGCWMYDVEGREYLDMLGGYSALSLGHGHPRILEALEDQKKKISVCPRSSLSEQLIRLSEELAGFCGMEMVLPVNSGAEAVETALKLARKWGYVRKGIDPNKAEIIVAKNNFHGRTTTVISFSTEPKYKDLFGPLTPGFSAIDFNDTDSLEKAINENTAAFLVEPIQGEGGINVPFSGYLTKCLEICRGNNVLLIADEVQTGLARTGRRFACDHEGVKPDLYILGKALGGGVLPISAVVGSRELLSVFEPGDHGSTFGGNPLACRVAREVLKIIWEENLDRKAQELGQYLREKLRSIESPHVKEVRGKGLLIGVELHKSGPKADDFCERLLQEGMLCKGTKEYVLRFAPPLTITHEELDWGLEKIERIF